jgi:hypothetical protein
MLLSRPEEAKMELVRAKELLDGVSGEPEGTDEDSANSKDCESQLKRLNAGAKPDR